MAPADLGGKMSLWMEIQYMHIQKKYCNHMNRNAHLYILSTQQGKLLTNDAAVIL